MNPHPPADWFEFWVRFVFGALLGAVVGLSAFQGSGTTHPWVALLVCSVVVGLVAGWFGDRFWHTLGRWFWFWW